MIYQKRVNVGEFLKKNEDYKEGDILTIANEGQQIPSQQYTDKKGNPKMQDIFMVRTSSGKEGSVNFNGNTIGNLIDSYGSDSINWIGKKVKIMVIWKDIKGKNTRVFYFFHPDTVFDNATGEFIAPKNNSEEGKTVNMQSVNQELVNQEIDNSNFYGNDPITQMQADMGE